MENAQNDKVQENAQESAKSPIKWKFIIGGIAIVVVLLLAGLSYYQATRFNANIKINGTNVGGLTASQALKKLQTSLLKNQVYVGNEQIYDGRDTKSGFTNQDLSNVQKTLKSQWTFFPSSMGKNYQLIPNKAEQNQSQTMKQLIEQKLTAMNKNLKAPKDAEAQLVNGQITVSKSIDGEQYDIPQLLQEYQTQEYNSVIHLNPVFIKPVKEDSPIVKKEENVLQALLQRTVTYKVENKQYTLKASDLIKNASVSKNIQVTIDPQEIDSKIAEINNSQATLNKNFTFRTHSGSVISVQGEGYGWAIDVDKESKVIQNAFVKGQAAVSATNLYGNGWGSTAIGYDTTTNNGIGDTYAEVSIAQQQIWLYRNGKLVVTTNVVTGRHDTGEDTSQGVWYILYKRSPSTLVGSETGNPHYSVKVQYWAPFTNSGQGFHDASWRKNWSSTAYLTDGSGGCVNTPPSIMQTVYNNLSEYEPVIIY